MNETSDVETRAIPAPARRMIYVLLASIAAGGMIGRIMAVNSVDRIALESRLRGEGRKNLKLQRPFLSANDRSRWCTIRALVEHGTYAIDDVIAEPNWDTIDMVKHPNGHLYSSKPPLLATLMAGEYWLIHRTTGATLGTHPYAVGRLMLVTLNVLPMMIFIACIAWLAERLVMTDWARLFVVGMASFGTFLSTFAVTLNNHIPGTVCATIALVAAYRIWREDERRLICFAICGVFAAMTAACELPALSLLAALSVALLWKAPRETLLGFVPGAALVVVAFFGTTYAAVQSLKPPYMHRGEADNWYEYEYEAGGRVRQSYWQDRQGIDQGEPSPARYALHALLGHHGVFSLTPVWLLAIPGVWMLARRRDRPQPALALLVASISVTCIVFFLARPLVDRNYGGMTTGFRWLFWLAPLWLVAIMPALDWAERRGWRRAVCYVLLAASVGSVAYAVWNPWTHPWIWNFLKYLEQIGWLAA